MTAPLDIVFLGLSLSSSWGNGHATTYRALLRGLNAEGHRVLFLERDQPWYASSRDLPDPDFCRLALYEGLDDLDALRDRLERADAVVIGSYVPDAIALIDRLRQIVPGRLVFYDIDTPITLDALRSGDAPYIARRQLPMLDLYLSFSGGYALDQLHLLGVRRAEALYCSVDEAAYRPLSIRPVWDLGYLGTYSPDRQPGLEALLLEPARRMPNRRFVVAGSQFPDTIEWPANVDRIDHVPPQDHATFYNSQRFTLNVTRAAMRSFGHSPSVRLFEAAACGTPIISDSWPGLTELLPEGEALVLARQSEDVIRTLGMAEDRRQALAAAARSTVLKHHTGRARARQATLLLRSLRIPQEVQP